MSDIIQTTKGTITPDEMGPTLVHEHASFASPVLQVMLPVAIRFSAAMKKYLTAVQFSQGVRDQDHH